MGTKQVKLPKKKAHMIYPRTQSELSRAEAQLKQQEIEREREREREKERESKVLSS
jgi:hypothetical protein